MRAVRDCMDPPPKPPIPHPTKPRFFHLYKLRAYHNFQILGQKINSSSKAKFINTSSEGRASFWKCEGRWFEFRIFIYIYKYIYIYPTQLRYVDTSINPADLATRSICPIAVVEYLMVSRTRVPTKSSSIVT